MRRRAKGISTQAWAAALTASALVVQPVWGARQDLTELDLRELMEMDVTLVTAQKRTEDSSTVPVSMTVVKGDRIRSAGLRSTRDLQEVAPGVTTAGTLNSVMPYIRGVGTDNITSVEPSITVYVDGVYQAHRSEGFFDLADVEQIEVLKGPQGTLYGRNTTAGAIKVTTRGPSDHLESDVQVTAGNLHQRDGSFFIAGPLSDRMRASFAAHGRQQDGYYDNILGLDVPKSEDFYTMRGRVQFDVTDTFDAELFLKYMSRDDSVNAATELSGHPTAVALGYVAAHEPFETASEVTDAHNRIDGMNAALKLNWRLQDYRLQSITSYDNLLWRTALDLDATSAPQAALRIHAPSRALTQELLLAPLDSPSRLDWLVGAFYMDDRNTYDPLGIYLRSPSGADVSQLSYGKTRTQASAVFGDATLSVTEQFSLTAGLRYSYENKHLTDGGMQVTGRPLTAYSDHDYRWDKASYRLVGKYLLGRSLLYAKTETGAKSGTLNNYMPADPGPTASESIRSYELGAKYPLDSLPARVSMAAFYNDYRDLQLALVDRVANTGTYGQAEKAETYGIESSIEMKLARYWQVDAGFTWLKAHYLDSPVEGVQIIDPAGGHVASSLMNLSGNYLARAPELTANLGASFEYPLANGSVFASGNYYRSSRVYFDLANLYSQDPFGVLNARVGYRSRTGWNACAWAKNLNDATYLSGVTVTRYGAFGQYNEPRTYGVSFGYSFGE